MRLPNLLSFILLIIIACLCLAGTAHARSDPILITPDSAFSLYSRVVFDNDGNLHFFFSNNRNETFPPDHYDVFHCKVAQDGSRLTDDLQLDSTDSHAGSPDPLLGSDGKLHVVWDDANYNYTTGIYYCRLDVNGNIEVPATRVFPCSVPLPPKLFQDTDGNLNVVWIVHDTLFYGKFDTNGQILIPKTQISFQYSVGLSILEGCIDGQNLLHLTYRHYWGSGDEWNLGYSRVNNQGQVQVEYAPLTPEITGIVCSSGSIIADSDDNLHLLYLFTDFGLGQTHEKYRKMNQALSTIYDIVLDTINVYASSIGGADIDRDDYGRIVLSWVSSHPLEPLKYKLVRYTAEGQPITSPETVYTRREGINWPDIATGPGSFTAYNCTSSWEGYQTSKIIYLYDGSPQGINFDPPMKDVSIKLTVFPNPSNGNLRIILPPDLSRNVRLSLYDSRGRLLCDRQYPGMSTQLTLEFDKSAPSGVYYLKIASSYKEIFQTLIHQK
jgi:hypothetical protein